jgi:hypothetical protein
MISTMVGRAEIFPCVRTLDELYALRVLPLSQHAKFCGKLSLVCSTSSAGGRLATGNANVNHPLLQAANQGHIQIVELLLAIGTANVNFRGNRECTLLWLAALNGHTAVIELLLENANTDVKAVA